MRTRHSSLTLIVVLVAVLALYVSGCGKKEAAPTGQAMSPPTSTSAQPTVEQPTTEKASEGASAGGIGDKFSKLLASAKPPSSYEMKIIPPSGPDQKPMSALFKMVDRKPVKAKMMNPDGEGWILTDYEAKAMYMYNAKEDKIIKMPVKMNEQGKVAAPADFVDSSAKVTGADTVDGVKCWVYSTTAGGNSEKVWIGKKDGLPRQVESNDGIIKFEYLRINSVPDSEFELPSGVEVMDMPTMPGTPPRGN